MGFLSIQLPKRHIFCLLENALTMKIPQLPTLPLIRLLQPHCRTLTATLEGQVETTLMGAIVTCKFVDRFRQLIENSLF